MIGHQLNGCTVVAAVPSAIETYTILAVRIPGHPDAPGDEYVTASVHVSQLPAPEFWHNGHYFNDLEAACAGFLDRSQSTTAHMARAIEDALEALNRRGWVVVNNVTDLPVSKEYDKVEHADSVCCEMNRQAGPGGLYGVRRVNT